jgi:hypothetical protein
MVMAYYGRIEIVPHVLNTWIPHHESFASVQWIEAQVRWGHWEWHRESRIRFSIFPSFDQGRRNIRVEIRGNYYPRTMSRRAYVKIDYAHVL